MQEILDAGLYRDGEAMIPTRKQELEKLASAHLAQYPDDVEAVKILVDFAITVEREVWERAAQYCRGRHSNGYTLNDVSGCGNEGDIALGASNDEARYIENWLREQMKEARS